jgi:multidrug efflux system membrane fusion protein
VRADRAALEAARLELAYCELRAPISGLTGRLKVTAGNLAGPTGPALVTINQLDPIYVNFAVPEARLAEIQKHRAAGPLPVRALVPGAAGPVIGELTLIENAVDRATGTIRLRAAFANGGHALWPGQFVEAILTLTWIENAVMIPSQALQTGQQGSFVFVVKEDLTAEMRPVVAGVSVGAEVVIQSGLEAGEAVVIDGQLRLTPGARVEIKNANPAPAAP